MSGVSRDFAQQIPALNRFGHYLGTISGSAATDNGSTGSPFTIPVGCAVLCQPDAACYLSSEFTHSTISSSNAVLVGANEKWTAFLWSTESQVAMLPVSGTVNVKVFKLENG